MIDELLTDQGIVEDLMRSSLPDDTSKQVNNCIY